MKDRLVGDGAIDVGADVLRRVVLEADDRRPVHADAVRLQLAHERQRVRAFQLGITGLGRLEAQPDPLDAELDELTDVVLSNRVC